MKGSVTHIHPGKSEEYLFEVGDLQVDIPSGKIAIDVESRSPAEYITLAFVISMLFVICRSNDTAGKDTGSMKRRSLHRTNSITSLYQKFRSTGKRNLFPDYFPLLVATGIQLSPKFYKRQLTRDNSFKSFVEQMHQGTSSMRHSRETTPVMNRNIYTIPNMDRLNSKGCESYSSNEYNQL